MHSLGHFQAYGTTQWQLNVLHKFTYDTMVDNSLKGSSDIDRYSSNSCNIINPTQCKKVEGNRDPGTVYY